MCHVITTPRVYLFFNVGWKQRSRKIHLVLILFVLCRPQIHACFRFYQFLISFSMVGTTLFQHCKLRFLLRKNVGECVHCASFSWYFLFVLSILSSKKYFSETVLFCCCPTFRWIPYSIASWLFFRNNFSHIETS